MPKRLIAVLIAVTVFSSAVRSETFRQLLVAGYQSKYQLLCADGTCVFLQKGPSVFLCFSRKLGAEEWRCKNANFQGFLADGYEMKFPVLCGYDMCAYLQKGASVVECTTSDVGAEWRCRTVN